MGSQAIREAVFIGTPRLCSPPRLQWRAAISERGNSLPPLLQPNEKNKMQTFGSASDGETLVPRVSASSDFDSTKRSFLPRGRPRKLYPDW